MCHVEVTKHHCPCVYFSVLPTLAWKYLAMQACREAQGKSSCIFPFLPEWKDLRLTGGAIGHWGRGCSSVIITPEQKNTDLLTVAPISVHCEQFCFQILVQLYKKDQVSSNEVAASADFLACLSFQLPTKPWLSSDAEVFLCKCYISSMSQARDKLKINILDVAMWSLAEARDLGPCFRTTRNCGDMEGRDKCELLTLSLSWAH